MARKKNKSAGKADEPPTAEPVAAVPADDGEEEDDEASGMEVELLQVDVGDVVKLKQVLDETVALSLIDPEGLALLEDYRADNIKLFIMVAACACAGVAQFAPLPFPESRPVLGLCCAAYFVLSGILQLITTFNDRDCIMITQPVETAKHPDKNADVEKFGIRVRTQLPRFSEFYTVILEFHNYTKDGKEAQPLYATKTWSVGNFFDVDGFFAEDILMVEVEGLFTAFCQGKFGKPTEYDDGKRGILHLMGFEGLEASMNKKTKASSGKLKKN